MGNSVFSICNEPIKLLINKQYRLLTVLKCHQNTPDAAILHNNNTSLRHEAT